MKAALQAPAEHPTGAKAYLLRNKQYIFVALGRSAYERDESKQAAETAGTLPLMRGWTRSIGWRYERLGGRGFLAIVCGCTHQSHDVYVLPDIFAFTNDALRRPNKTSRKEDGTWRSDLEVYGLGVGD